jgi:hypothetical protein
MRKLVTALARSADLAVEASNEATGVERSRLRSLADILRAESRAISRRPA